MKYSIIVMFAFALQCCKQPSEDKTIYHPVALANGIENFSKVKMLEFTFNVKRDTAKASSRHWQWYPQTNEVVFITDSSNTKFKRGDTSTPELKKLNARFTNDEYWLIYPFHLSWDKGCEISDSGKKVSPINGETLEQITIKYNNTDGFTPGDTYHLYADDNNKIKEWAFHSKSAAEPSLITTWDNYKEFNRLQIAQDHKSKDGKFRIWFTEIKVDN